MKAGAFRIEVTAEANPASRETIASGLRRYNEHAAGPLHSRPLNVLLQDSNGEVVGGLWGRTYWRWLFVELFYVPADFRGLNLGARLLKAAEEEASARGCIGAWLDTFEFQAPGFYEQFGYRRFGELADQPPDHRRIFFSKRL